MNCRTLILLLSGLLLCSWHLPAAAQPAALQHFPEGSQPREVGDRIVRKFLRTPHTRFGNPRAEKAPNYIT